MKKTFITFPAMLLLAFTLMLTGCKSNSSYNYDLEKYITIADYNNIKIDTKSDTYQLGLSYEKYNTLSQNNIVINSSDLTKGKVQALDTATIDYVGKKDGVAFEGGTGSDYELLIGSSSFIEGFESGLIGKDIGSTVDLNLKFPDNYSTKDLAGANVVFTVTIKKVSRPEIPEIDDQIAQKLGYSSAEEFLSTVENSYFRNTVWNEYESTAKVLKYPEKEVNAVIDEALSNLEDQAKQNNTTVEAYLSANGLTLDQYKERLKTSYAEPYVKSRMICYSISKKENITVSDDEVNNYLSSSNSSETKPTKTDKENAKETLLLQKIVEFLSSKASK